MGHRITQAAMHLSIDGVKERMNRDERPWRPSRLQAEGGNTRSFLVTIAICSMQHGTKVMADALYCASRRRDIEGPCDTHGNPPDVGSHLLASRHNCFDHIACLKHVYVFRLLGPCSRKAVTVHQAHLARAMSRSGNEQGLYSLYQ